VHKLAGLLPDALYRNKAHVGPGHRLSNGCGVGDIGLAAFAAHAVRRDELGRHQAHRVAELGKLARPLMGTTARLHDDHARRQIGDEFEQFGAWHFRSHQSRLPVSSTPYTAKTFFARSIPKVTMAMISLFAQVDETRFSAD